MTANPGTALVVFVLYHRPGRGRWRKIGTAPTHLEAVLLIVGKGDFRIAERPVLRVRSGQIVRIPGGADDGNRDHVRVCSDSR